MKKIAFFLVAFAALLTSCSKDSGEAELSVPVTFSLPEIYRTSDMKVSSLSESEMTDLWVFDYVGGSLVNYVHQSPSSSDWGQPTMTLTSGCQHQIYFVASNGVSPTVNSSTKIISFGTVGDSFWKKLTVTVTPTTGDQNVTLDRVVTKLKLTVTEGLDTNAVYQIMPAMWYYGINYETGNPVGSITNHSVVVSPSIVPGTDGGTFEIYGFSSTTEWFTNVVFRMTTTQNSTDIQLNNVPFKANRVTEYVGTLNGSGGLGTIILNDGWCSPNTYTW